MTHKSYRNSAIIPLVLSALAFLLFSLDTYAAPQPNPTLKTSSSKASASAKRPDSQGRPNQYRYAKQPTAKHRAMNRTKAQLMQSRREIAALDQQIVLARRGEVAVRQRHEASSNTQLRNAVRAATLERANLENRRADLFQQYRSLRTSYKQSQAAVNATRNADWRGRLGGKPKVRAIKARKLTINTAPLPPSGSGASRPRIKPKGILKTSDRYANVLAAKQANLY